MITPRSFKNKMYIFFLNPKREVITVSASSKGLFPLLIEGVYENIAAFISLHGVTTPERIFHLPVATFLSSSYVFVYGDGASGRFRITALPAFV